MKHNAPGPVPPQPKSLLGQIDEVCDRFEAAWKEGQPPQIGEYLAIDPTADDSPPRRRLLIELVMIDLEYRWQGAFQRPPTGQAATKAADPQATGEPSSAALPARPRLVDYVARFPELAPLEALPEELLAHERRVCERWGGRSGSFPGANNGAGGLDEFKGSDRFVVERRIGAGGMGVVYQAYDRERKELVAIKTVRNIEPRAIYRLKQEFRALTDLVLPNLVRLHELFSVAGRWFFTMEFVEGVDFLRYVRSGAKADGGDSSSGEVSDSVSTERMVPAGKLSTIKLQPAQVDTDRPAASHGKEADAHQAPAAQAPLAPTQLARLRGALKQIAEGVLGLHQAGKLHRDIKPSNVLVTHEGHVVLLDFGLITELERREHTATTGYNVVGSVPYMSPEQAAGERLSPASDWYSVGVILYEALTGRQPFHGRALDVLTSKQEKDPPPPREVVAGVPQDLNWLCVALLRRDAAARPSGAEVLGHLGSAPTDPQTAPYLQPASLRQAPFVGREEHLNTLRDAFRVMKRGRAVAAYVHGRPGVGKTAFVHRFLDQIREREDTVVLAGRCHECESVPYKALDSLVDALSHYLVRLPRLEAEALLPRDVEALARAFPVLRRVEAVAQSRRLDFDTPDRHELRRRAFGALRELLARLGDRKALVLHIDDLQWGDLDSVALLSDLLRPPHPPVLLLVVCHRAEDKTTNPVLHAIGDLQAATSRYIDVCEIEVDPLTQEEARELACALIRTDGPGTETLGEAIARESGGNPYFVQALVRHQQAQPHLPNGSLSTEAASLDEVLWARVRSLPEGARRLLEIVAVAGHPLRLVDACQAAELSAGCHEALGNLRTSHLVRTSGERLEDEIEAYDERIRETVVSRLSGETTLGYHRGLAAALEAFGQADPAVLAAHYVGAGAPEKAGEWYAVAAAQAVETLAFDRAAELYRLALQLRPTSGAKEQDLRPHLADALANAGRGVEAAEEYLAAARPASPAEALELRRSAAIQFLISGHIDKGLAVLRTVLATVGLRLPRTRRRARWGLVLRRLRLRLRGTWFLRRDASQIPAKQLSRIDACWSAAGGLSIIDPIWAASFRAQNLLLSLRSGEPYRIARSLALEAAQVATAGGRTQRRVERLLAKAQRLAQHGNNPHGTGLVCLAGGAAACFCGRWKRAVELSDEAQSIFRDRCTGVTWEVNTAQGMGLAALSWSGEVAELARRLPSARAQVRKRGDLYNLARLGTLNLPELAANHPDEAQRQLHEATVDWQTANHLLHPQGDLSLGMGRHPQAGLLIKQVNELYAQIQIDLYRGDSLVAWNRMVEQWPLLAKSLFLRVQLLRVMIHDARARSALAAAASALDPEPFLGSAEQDARRLQRERERWVRPLARLIRAGVAAFRGQTSKAVTLLRDAASGFDAADMALHAAATRRQLGELIGEEAGRTLVGEADGWMAGQNILAPTRMTALYAPGFPA